MMRIRKSDISVLQTVLASEGFYSHAVDGLAGPKTWEACDQKLRATSTEIGFDPFVISNTRRVTLTLQLVCKEHDIDPGPLDGFYGSRTQIASTLLQRHLADEQIPHFDEITPIDVNPNGFPKSTDAALVAHYGRLNPDCTGLEGRIVRVDCPWEMRLDWSLGQKRRFFRVHELVAESLERVITSVFEHYGLSEIQRLGLDRFSGDYVPRKMRGSRRCSTHAWGIAIDFFGSRNELRRSTADTPPPTLAHADLNFWWEAWESEGWYCLGRMEDRDWMHIQAAKGSRSAFFHNA